MPTERDTVWLRRHNEQVRLALFTGERRVVHATCGGNHVERAQQLDVAIEIAKQLIAEDSDMICELSRAGVSLALSRAGAVVGEQGPEMRPASG